jgi:16S rRNA (adenine1518-N6/adenine1519-N6)-dimethyltransferase
VKLSELRERLRASGLSPKKSFGQNFLVSDGVLRTMAGACVPDFELGRAEVVELGAGLGALTGALVVRAAHVTAVERDRDIVPLLRHVLDGAIDEGKLELSESDAQRFDVEAAFGEACGPRVLCGNLPYSITGKLLRLAIEHAGSLDRVVFMVQEEVAARLLAKPGDKDYGALTVFTRAAFDVALVARVPAGAFHPAPRVSSAIVVLVPVRPPRARETETFRALTKAAFAMRRKTLRNAWRSVVADAARLERLATEVGISLDARGETLDVEAFAKLASAIDASLEHATSRGDDPAMRGR